MKPRFFATLTHYGEQVLANAIANNQPLNITKMAVGDGNGQEVIPDQTQTTLVNEVYRSTLNDISRNPQNDQQVIFELLIPSEIGGFWSREMGIFDESEKLVAVANCPASFKPILASGSGKVQVLRMILQVSSSDAVTLSVDDGVIMVTRDELNKVKTQINQRITDLSNPDGFKFIGQAESVAQLRTIRPTEHGQRILVKAYYADGSTGGGEFMADLQDLVTPDDGGTCFVVEQNRGRWKRVKAIADAYDFGWKAGHYPNAAQLKNHKNQSLLPNAQFCFKNRTELLVANTAGKLAWLPDGTVVIAEGAFYVKKEGSKIIQDLHNWDVIPEFEHFGNYRSGYDVTAKTYTTISYRIWNDVAINVIEIRNPKLRTLQKIFAPNVQNDGTVLRVTPREFARATGHRLVINCDGWRAPNGADWRTSEYGKSVGLQIANGKLYQDWLPYENRDEAVVMLKTGQLVAAKKDDGISGQQWIE